MDEKEDKKDHDGKRGNASGNAQPPGSANSPPPGSSASDTKRESAMSNLSQTTENFSIPTLPKVSEARRGERDLNRQRSPLVRWTILSGLREIWDMTFLWAVWYRFVFVFR